MSLVTLEEAAKRLGIPLEVMREWTEKGLLAVHSRPRTPSLPPGVLGCLQLEQCVDEDELAEVADSMAWFQLSAENWDGHEGD
ncbi:MAG: hypothetical protein JNM56_17215 [Planctomycetia bacterium]|nr:hypothetical protein [Planctomycetia bacterium]